MIPAFMDDRTPSGERDVFNMLAAGPDEWVALHSLDLAPWNRGLRTEIDFVVVDPETGILCVEVKSHENLSFDGHRWSPETITRSPFKQALDGRYSFYRRLIDLAPWFANVPVVHCCIFPRASFEVAPNLSVQPWELIDMRAFRTFGSGFEFCADLKARMEKSISIDERLAPIRQRISPDRIESIIKCCLPVQRFRPDTRQEIKQRELEINVVLLEQQRPVLQLAAMNNRLIVFGAAGTGKTLIAMEVARRAAENGRRVALLCFNQLVGDWMRQRMEQIAPLLPNLVVGRAIRIMADMTGINIPDKPSPEFWESDMPQQLEDRLTDPDFKAAASFDYLVIDEAQDLLARPRLWECLGQFLVGGIDKGKFALFGDFDHQILSEREPVHESLAALDASDRPARWRLSENCRNYRIVGDTAVQLSGFGGTVYSGYLRTGGGVHNYDIYFYEHEQAQLDRLRQWLGEFKAQGYKPSEITLLSFRADHLSAGTRLRDAGYRLRSAWQAGDLTACASVHSFKGMENKVVILTDVVLDGQDFQRDLFYTGMTRATESVRVLCDKICHETLIAWLTGKADL